LREGDDLDVGLALEARDQGHGGMEVGQAVRVVDVGVGAQRGGAACDHLAQQVGAALGDRRQGGAGDAFVLDALAHGGGTAVRSPGQAPDGLVQVDVAVDQGGQQQGAGQVVAGAAGGGGDRGDAAMGDGDVHRAGGGGVVREACIGEQHRGSLILSPPRAKDRLMLDLVIRNARLQNRSDVVDIGVRDGRIAAVSAGLRCDAPSVDAAGRLVTAGLVETHIHLDKTCILDRCRAAEGSVAEAVRETATAKRGFTAEDVYARGRRTLEKCICCGTTRMRTQVELDPGIGMRGFEGVQALARDFAWAVEMEICVFPQEGLLNNPGTEALLVEGLRRGARVLGAAPYTDSDPRGQIERIFALARDFDVDIDMHLDLGEDPAQMQAEFVCDVTERFGWGGRVTIGHATVLSMLPAGRVGEVGRRLAAAGVAVTILPSTDLYLMGRGYGQAVPRGVVVAEPLLALGVACSVATNNVLNPFTPYGDGSLVRMANLYANVAHVGRPEALAGCLGMVTDMAAGMLRLPDYGVAVGNPADLVVFDGMTAEGVVAEIAQPLWGMKDGRVTFSRPLAMLHGPGRV
jgi:cytosine deaminase